MDRLVVAVLLQGGTQIQIKLNANQHGWVMRMSRL